MTPAMRRLAPYGPCVVALAAGALMARCWPVSLLLTLAATVWVAERDANQSTT